MKKLTSLLCVLLILAMCLTACSSTGGVQSSDPPKENTEAPSDGPDSSSTSEDPFADSPSVKFTFADNNASSSSVGQSLPGILRPSCPWSPCVN